MTNRPENFESDAQNGATAEHGSASSAETGAVSGSCPRWKVGDGVMSRYGSVAIVNTVKPGDDGRVWYGIDYVQSETGCGGGSCFYQSEEHLGPVTDPAKALWVRAWHLKGEVHQAKKTLERLEADYAAVQRAAKLMEPTA